MTTAVEAHHSGTAAMVPDRPTQRPSRPKPLPTLPPVGADAPAAQCPSCYKPVQPEWSGCPYCFQRLR